jgi:membrane protease YdiL (CAAX protease family)
MAACGPKTRGHGAGYRAGRGYRRLVTLTPVNPPPGWYADPGGTRAYRWWDGYRWTAHTSPYGTYGPTYGPYGAYGPAGGQPERRGRQIPARAAWWGLAGVAAGLLLSGILQVVAAGAFPGSDAASLLFGEVGLWLSLGATCVLVSRKYGTGRLSVDFGLRFEPRDIPIGLATSLLLLMVAAVIGGLFSHTGLHGSNTQIITRQQGDTAGVVVVAFIAAVGAPVFEELFFRGFLRTSLAARLGTGAVWAQALLFGLAHYQFGLGWQNVSVVVAIGGLGVVLGFLAERTGRLAAGMIAHGMFNLLVTLTIVLGPAGVLGRVR